MIQYILECIVFQFVFLVIYDLFLKRETFFQWNRVYLIGTYTLSLILPLVKIQALQTTLPQEVYEYPDFLWDMNVAIAVTPEVEKTAFTLPWAYVMLCFGMLLALLFFCYKLFQIYTIKKEGQVQDFKEYTQVIMANSTSAFSFFKIYFSGG